MILETNEYVEYLNANLKFLHYVYKKLVKPVDFNTFKAITFEEKVKARNYFLEHDFLLEEYLKKNSSLSVIETAILNGFKRRITGDFIILKQLKKYTVFIHSKSNKVYGVLGLSDYIGCFFDYFPVLIHTTILPYENKIVYDGFISLYSYIGRNMAEDYNNIYKQAKMEKKIITNL